MISKVIAGDFENQILTTKGGKLVITKGAGGRIIDSSTVVKYEVLTEDSQKSAASGVARGIVGGALLGGVGMVAGAVSAKSKGTYQIAVEFVDGKKSLLEVDTPTYKQIVKECFDTGKPKLTAEELTKNEQEFLEKDGKSRNLLMGISVLIIFACIIAGIIVAADKGYISTTSGSSEQTATETK